MEIVLTTLHAGGKFDDSAYITSGGLHGVGISVVNALSKILNVKVYNNGKVYSQKYSKGKVASKISIYKCSKKLKGTEISFIPDKDIFDNISFNPKKLYQFIKMKAVLVRETSILFKVDKELIKDSTPSKELFYYKKGIEDFLKKYSNSKIKLFDKYFYINSFLNENEKCEVIVSFIKNEKNMFKSYCNTIETPDGGSHEIAIKNGMIKSIKIYGKKNQFGKISNINTNDIFDYSDTIVSIFINEPSFEGQTKKRIVMPKLQKILEDMIQDQFLKWLNSNKKIANLLIEKLIERFLLRSDLSKFKELERKTVKEKNRLPGKLVDCSSRSIDGSEIFIVEGDSAGGSAKQARSREIQAILPLRGKILNVYSVSLSKIADNSEIQNLIQSLGCGIGKNFDLSKLRYEKIILMTDADVDGSHIASLLITFFYKYMKPIIENNRLFLAMPPLYKIYNKDKELFAYNEKEKENIIKKEFKNNSYSITRFKGLGEMPAEQLKQTTMSISKRKLISIKMQRGSKEQKNIEKLFEKLMGKKPELRFKFIQDNVNFIKQIDI